MTTWSVLILAALRSASYDPYAEDIYNLRRIYPLKTKGYVATLVLGVHQLHVFCQARLRLWAACSRKSQSSTSLVRYGGKRLLPFRYTSRKRHLHIELSMSTSMLRRPASEVRPHASA